MLPLLFLLLAADPAPKLSPAIAVAPFVGQAAPAGTPVRISGSEFELLILNNYTGPVTWDVTTPDGVGLPVKWFQCKPKTIIIGVRAGQPAPAEFETPDSPAVAVYAIGSGRAVVAAWGVADGRPIKLATMLIDANRGPMPPPPGPDPADPIYPTLAGIFGADQSPTKRADAVKLAGVYDQAGGMTERAGTLAELLTMLGAAGRATVPMPALASLREMIASELNQQLGTADMPMTPELRARCKAQFARFAVLLRKLGA
jgi:hypothetical protein